GAVLGHAVSFHFTLVTLARTPAAATAAVIARHGASGRPVRSGPGTDAGSRPYCDGSGPYCGPASSLAGPQSSTWFRGGRRAGRCRPRAVPEGSECRLVELHDIAVDVLDDLAGGRELRQHVAGEELRDAHL